MHESVRTLLTGIVDYAGLFPPAKLDMVPSVRDFASYRSSAESWMLARFVVPVARLREFAEASSDALPRTGEPWRLSALVGADLNADVETVFDFNSAYAPGEGAEHADGGAVIDTLEIRASDGASIDEAMRAVPEQLDPFFEIPWNGDARGVIAAIAGTGARAKIRTGGVTPELIPPTDAVARFIHACASADVAFKATAGLHHPVRAEQPLTYEDTPPRATMHGYLNVFLGAAIAQHTRASVEEIDLVLNETDPKAFDFHGAGVEVRGVALDTAQLARTRETLAISFGSCSFTEPVDDARAIDLL
ncbi:MAG: hypothetical protein AAGD00_02345 [Planctomycetota bacterium]